MIFDFDAIFGMIIDTWRIFVISVVIAVGLRFVTHRAIMNKIKQTSETEDPGKPLKKKKK